VNTQERSLDHYCGQWPQSSSSSVSVMQRVFLSGGEPLLRRDLPEIVDMYSSFIIGLPTNATPRPGHGAAAGRGG
jgi:organic radical activating enzyme